MVVITCCFFPPLTPSVVQISHCWCVTLQRQAVRDHLSISVGSAVTSPSSELLCPGHLSLCSWHSLYMLHGFYSGWNGNIKLLFTELWLTLAWRPWMEIRWITWRIKKCSKNNSLVAFSIMFRVVCCIVLKTVHESLKEHRRLCICCCRCKV